jgi:DNA-binding MarR family transcriptional regulator
MFKKAKKEKVEMMQSLLKNLTAEERETLLKILHKMLKVKTK